MDESGHAAGDVVDDGPERGPTWLDGFRTPEVLGLAALVLAAASLLGFGVLSGNLVLILGQSQFGPTPRGVQIGAAVLGAGLALVPVGLGLAAIRLLLEDDPLWVGAVARAAVVVGAVSVVLRLANALALTTTDSTPPIPL